MRAQVLLPKVFNFSFTYNTNKKKLYPGEIVEVPFGKEKEIGVVWPEESSKLRKSAKLFPFCKVCLLKLSGENYELTELTANALAKYLIYFCKQNNWKLIGPAPSLIAKIGKKFRWQILIHGPEGTKIPLPDRASIWKLIPKNVFLTIDVNPVEL